jgi:hypothetical protein
VKLSIFECSTATYYDCTTKNLFGSNVPWPLQVKKGDYCCLFHYEVGTLFALWQATTDGARNLVPKAWGGRFPFQVKVALSTTNIIEIPKNDFSEEFFNPATGNFDNLLDAPRADLFLHFIHNYRPQ